MIFYILLWMASALLVGALAMEKSIKFWNAYFITLFLSPLVGLLVVGFSKKVQHNAKKKAQPLKFRYRLGEVIAETGQFKLVQEPVYAEME